MWLSDAEEEVLLDYKCNHLSKTSFKFGQKYKFGEQWTNIVVLWDSGKNFYALVDCLVVLVV